MLDDPTHQQMATNLATQLLQQLDAKIQSTPNDPDKFLMKGKLQEISESLKVRPQLFLSSLSQEYKFFEIDCSKKCLFKCHNSYHLTERYLNDAHCRRSVFSCFKDVLLLL